MIKNNYNKNDSGPSIEVLAFYDCDESRRLFEENIKILQHSGYHTTCKAFYIDGGNLKDDESIDFSIQGTVKELRRFLKAEGRGYSDSEIRNFKKAELQESVLDHIQYNDKITVLNYEDLQEQHFGGGNRFFTGKELSPYKIEIQPSKRIEKTAIRGYSQGDYAEVFYCPDDIKEVWGKAPTDSELNDLFTQLFYDAPVYARIEVNGDEYYYHDYADDSYKWDREKFIQGVAKDSGISAEEFESLVPENLDYAG